VTQRGEVQRERTAKFTTFLVYKQAGGRRTYEELAQLIIASLFDE